MLGELGIERRVAERQALGQGDVPCHERATGQIEGDLDERLVERIEAAGEATHAGLVAERRGERLAERDRHVFHRVMGVDVQVAVGVHGEVEAAVAAELVEHVVVERDAGGHVGPARAVEVDGDGDSRLFGVALPRCSPHAIVHCVPRPRRPLVAARSLALTRSHGWPNTELSGSLLSAGTASASPRAARNRSFSTGSPIVMRRQPSSRDQPLQSRTRTPRSTSSLPHRRGRRGGGSA